MDNNQNGQIPPQAPPSAPTQPQSAPSANSQASHGMSHDTKTLIVILLLIFTYWIGLIFMWLWMKTWPKWLKIILTLPVFISIALAGYFVYFILQNPSQLFEESERMVNEELAETPTPSPFDQDGTPTPPVASASAVQSAIETGLNSEDYESLVPYMASLVQFEIEASEGVPAGDPQETVTNLAYLDTATPPWNFDQTNPIVESIKTQYAQEYGELYIGISSNDVLAAFGFDENGMINEIKVAATYKLLVSE